MIQNTNATFTTFAEMFKDVQETNGTVSENEYHTPSNKHY